MLTAVRRNLWLQVHGNVRVVLRIQVNSVLSAVHRNPWLQVRGNVPVVLKIQVNSVQNVEVPDRPLKRHFRAGRVAGLLPILTIFRNSAPNVANSLNSPEFN